MGYGFGRRSICVDIRPVHGIWIRDIRKVRVALQSHHCYGGLAEGRYVSIFTDHRCQVVLIPY